MSQEFSQAIAIRDNTLWKHLDTVTIEQAIAAFLQNLTFHTKRCYASGLRKIFSGGRCAITVDSTLQTMALCNLENVLDDLKHSIQGSEMTKQHACKVFISFTRFLERQTKGMIKKVLSKKGVDATFVRVREKAATKAMKMEEWTSFVKALHRISRRDALIAKAIFQGAKRLSEVLHSKIEDIDWINGKIAYRQLKSKLLEKKTVIAYPKEFMEDLNQYIDGRLSGFIFITKNNKPVSQPHIYRNFSYAAIQAKLSFHVHPHMLRATAITLFMKMGYHSDDIMKISGHCDAKAVLYYDKSEIEQNITEQVKLI